MAKKTVTVLGASGFAGNELATILLGHPEIAEVHLQSEHHAGKTVKQVHPTSPIDASYEDYSLSRAQESDCVFLALPGEQSIQAAKELDTFLIDLSPAHRFNPEFTYGLPEANREAIRKSNKIANPGCYATACILAALPLSGMKLDALSFDCSSGYSGGGSGKKYPFEENVIPYSLLTHYQEPEIAGFVSAPFTFAPHVVNAFRGLEATVHLFGEHEELFDVFSRFYSGEPFVRVTEGIPDFAAVRNTPYCVIGGFSQTEGRSVFVSAIDNLLKGAASQAVQNMNIRLRIAEYLGLRA